MGRWIEGGGLKALAPHEWAIHAVPMPEDNSFEYNYLWRIDGIGEAANAVKVTGHPLHFE